MDKKMEYVIVDGDIYSISAEMIKFVNISYNLAVRVLDGDMENTINMVKKYGKFVGSAVLTIRT